MCLKDFYAHIYYLADLKGQFGGIVYLEAIQVLALYISMDMTKTRNGLENGLVHGLNRILWKAYCITIQLF